MLIVELLLLIYNCQYYAKFFAPFILLCLVKNGGVQICLTEIRDEAL